MQLRNKFLVETLAVISEIKEDIKILKTELYQRLLRNKESLKLAASGKLDPYQAYEAIVVAGYDLHRYYSCLENILERIYKYTGEYSPQKNKGYHKELLERAFIAIEGIRPNILEKKFYEVVDELRRFRHAFRHVYRSALRGDSVERLTTDLLKVHDDIVANLEKFVDFLKSEVQSEISPETMQQKTSANKEKTDRKAQPANHYPSRRKRY